MIIIHYIPTSFNCLFGLIVSWFGRGPGFICRVGSWNKKVKKVLDAIKNLLVPTELNSEFSGDSPPCLEEHVPKTIGSPDLFPVGSNLGLWE
ncbi:jg18051 [Pararge aegeria aegeria]|uniref:Jg18051 protein n=1 Tax=Pararge aegeria aegeria TaxID=348720 RepID=A0A8S4RH77_9NEOP|nr:jg18051 [Pararge aegeria aegeria]